MSDSIVADVFIMILCVILLFIGPIYQNFDTADRLCDSIVSEVLNTYEKDIRKKGYIDKETYFDFLTDLARTGEVYEVEFIHTSRLAYPSGSDDYEIHEIKYGNDIILEQIKDGSKKYTMRYGDDFKIRIKEKKAAPSRLLVNIFANKGTETLLVFTGGGMIENEVYE